MTTKKRLPYEDVGAHLPSLHESEAKLPDYAWDKAAIAASDFVVRTGGGVDQLREVLSMIGYFDRPAGGVA